MPAATRSAQSWSRNRYRRHAEQGDPGARYRRKHARIGNNERAPDRQCPRALAVAWLVGLSRVPPGSSIYLVPQRRAYLRCLPVRFKRNAAPVEWNRSWRCWPSPAGLVLRDMTPGLMPPTGDRNRRRPAGASSLTSGGRSTTQAAGSTRRHQLAGGACDASGHCHFLMAKPCPAVHARLLRDTIDARRFRSDQPVSLEPQPGAPNRSRSWRPLPPTATGFPPHLFPFDDTSRSGRPLWPARYGARSCREESRCAIPTGHSPWNLSISGGRRR